MSDTNSLPYRSGVGMMVLNAADEVFVAQRIDTPGAAWQMPQGGIDDGEDLEAAAFRELEEEIGTRNVEILTRTEDWLRYDLPDNLAQTVWGGRFRGQQQIWFLMRFLGTDSEINVATEHPEFNDWCWMPMNQIADQIVDFKRDLYRELVEIFGAQTWR